MGLPGSPQRELRRKRFPSLARWAYLSVTRPDHARRMVQFAQAMDRIVALFNG